MSDKIKILVVEPMKPCEVLELPDTLDAMRQIVGGDIEAVTSLRDASAIVCNENGKLLDLPHNRPLLDESGLLPLDILHGTFFITGVSGERFVSLTDEQIQHYKNLYDNAAVLTAERPENQAEIAPESVMLNFAVDCQLSFRFARDGQEAAESKDAFISHVTEVFNEDTALAERTVGGLDFDFRDGCAEVRYRSSAERQDSFLLSTLSPTGAGAGSAPTPSGRSCAICTTTTRTCGPGCWNYRLSPIKQQRNSTAPRSSPTLTPCSGRRTA